MGYDVESTPTFRPGQLHRLSAGVIGAVAAELGFDAAAIVGSWRAGHGEFRER